MAGPHRVQSEDVWYWLQDVTHDLLLPPESHGWTTGGLMVSTMIISMLVYDVISFLVELVSSSSGAQGGLTTTIMGGRRGGRGSRRRLVSAPHLPDHRSAEATSRVLNAIEDDRYGTLEGRRLQRLEDSGGPRF